MSSLEQSCPRYLNLDESLHSLVSHVKKRKKKETKKKKKNLLSWSTINIVKAANILMLGLSKCHYYVFKPGFSQQLFISSTQFKCSFLQCIAD
jgi:hypothetical protein